MTLFLKEFDPYDSPVTSLGAEIVERDFISFDQRYTNPRLLKKIGLVLYVFGAHQLELISKKGRLGLGVMTNVDIRPSLVAAIERMRLTKVSLNECLRRCECYGGCPPFRWWGTRIRWLLATYPDDDCRGKTYCVHHLSVRDLTFVCTPQEVWYHHRKYKLCDGEFRSGKFKIIFDEPWWKVGSWILTKPKSDKVFIKVDGDFLRLVNPPKTPMRKVRKSF